ncbi:unnamed protein product [Brassicogethes aeneus]|uniref:Uncharacterized protein n=1 Tax=Brassicogethes aeneus TaxID=1431903 RepID=A0A9P0B9Q0_BRAAE|nr:unnamed protein product [Brassicogethes aeneus]
MFKVLCVLFVIAIAAQCQELTSCKCWEDYSPNLINGSPKCVNNLFFHVVPCDLTKKPRCVCTGSTGIVTSGNGAVWCSVFEPGKDLKRWECENKAEWKAYFAANPEEEYKQYN